MDSRDAAADQFACPVAGERKGCLRVETGS
jgi:hypothetical protein